MEFDASLQDILSRADEGDRRRKKRFVLDQDLTYRLLYGPRSAESGIGRSVNMSSGGIWFTTDVPLAPGMPIEISMAWPVLLREECPMKLVIYGCVVRSSEQGTAVAIERYEFRTQGSHPRPKSGDSAADNT